MKQQIYLGMVFLGLALSVPAQPIPLWETPGGNYIVPSAAYPFAQPIDAVRFYNPQGAIFSINAGGNSVLGSSLLGNMPFDFSDCLYYTNQGYMACSPGFIFDTRSNLNGVLPQPSVSVPQPAEWFVNQGSGFNGGIIDVSGVTYTTVGGGTTNTFVQLTGNGKLMVNAKHILNSGDIFMGNSGLIQLAGDSVDLTGGTILMTNNYQTFGMPLTTAGMLDNYWGVGRQPFGSNPNADFGGGGFFLPTFSPTHIVTNRAFQTMYTFLPLPNAVAYGAQFQTGPSNILSQVVFLSNTNLAFTNSVYFFGPGGIGVQWQWLTTNWPSLSLTTNNLFLLDDFGEATNLQVLPNGTVGTRLTYMPSNYTFSTLNPLFFFLTTPATPITPAQLAGVGFPNANQTNEYAAYQALFTPGTSLPQDVPGGDVTNTDGRIEISANATLDLTDSQISTLNYLLLKAPVQYLGNEGAQILAPTADLVLGSRTGSLVLSNLMAASLPYPSGLISLYSERLTNVDNTTGITNSIHVLMVNSAITPTTAAMVHNCNLSARNIAISDIVNLSSNLTLHAQSLTLTTNTPASQNAAGQINILNPAILWPAATPGLQFMTNWGQFTASNSIFFGGSRTQPSYDPNSINVPYNTFVNYGQVSASGAYFWAKYFENAGIIDAGVGPMQLQLGFSVRLHDGAIYATNSDIRLTASDLIVSNEVIQAGGALSLSVTKFLDDGSYLLNSADSISNKNSWVANNGLSLPSLPICGASLLGTTVSGTNLSRHPVTIEWAGADRGPNANGFYNNAALGRLVLSGLDPKSSVVFMPAGGCNALYVDSLEIWGTLTNTDDANNLVNITNLPNMKVYYGQASLNGIPNSRKLNGANNGTLIWVPNFNTGFFSSSWVEYPSGASNRVNTTYLQDYEQHNGGVPPPISPDQSNTAPTNPVPYYPAPDLSPGPWIDSPAGDNPGTPPVAVGPSKLDLPAAARSGEPSANFVSASYSGLFADTNGIAPASSGYFTVKTTRQGNYTGKLICGGQSYSFTGKLTGSSQVATASFSWGKLNLKFWLVAADASQLQGQVTSPDWSADLVAFRQATSKSEPKAATLRGTYTLLIPPAEGGPDGFGFGTLKTDAAGRLRWAGTLGDGTPVTQSSSFSSGGLWGLYASLYSGKGSALGWLQLSTGSATNLSGQCLWVKPAGMGPRYPQGFTNDVQALGSTYVRRPGAVLALSGGAGTLNFSGGGLTNGVPKALVLDRHNHVTSSDSPAPSLKLNPSTGLFSGSAVLPAVGRISFQGAVFQNGNFAAGNFIGATQSGEVFLGPAP